MDDAMEWAREEEPCRGMITGWGADKGQSAGRDFGAIPEEIRLWQIWLARAAMSSTRRHALWGDIPGIRREYGRDQRGLSLDRIRRDLAVWAQSAIEVLVPTDPLYGRVFGARREQGLTTPFILYMKGNPALLTRPGLALVGSRQPGDYGRKVTRDLVAALAGSDLVIISGGARGVDTQAHGQAMASGLSTICVLGGGIGRDYPRENGPLFRAMERDQLILSEYEPDSPPRRHQFPERNRIIAQLARAVVVTAASLESGSLITAEHAMDCNVPVLAAPWPMDQIQGQGCLFLLSTGALLISSPEQFWESIQRLVYLHP